MEIDKKRERLRIENWREFRSRFRHLKDWISLQGENWIPESAYFLKHILNTCVNGLKYSFPIFDYTKTRNMQANLLTLAIIAVALVVLVIFIIIRNKKDKDDFVKELNAEEDIPPSNKDVIE